MWSVVACILNRLLGAAGYMHFPDDRDLGYFNQLLAERLVYKVVQASVQCLGADTGGRTKRSTVWFTAMPRCVGSSIWG
jgi:hypothetical protein